MAEVDAHTVGIREEEEETTGIDDLGQEEMEEQFSEDSSHNHHDDGLLLVTAESSSSIETAITVSAPTYTKPRQAPRSIPLPTAPLNIVRNKKKETTKKRAGRVPPPIATEEDYNNLQEKNLGDVDDVDDAPPSSDQFAALLALGVAQQERVNAQVVTRHSPRLQQGQGQGQGQQEGVFPSSSSSSSSFCPSFSHIPPAPSPISSTSQTAASSSSAIMMSSDLSSSGAASSSSSSSLSKPLPALLNEPEEEDHQHKQEEKDRDIASGSAALSSMPSSSYASISGARPHASRSNTASTSSSNTTTATTSNTTMPASTYHQYHPSHQSTTTTPTGKMAAFAARVGNSSALQRFQRTQGTKDNNGQHGHGNSYISYPTAVTHSNNSSSTALGGIAEAPPSSSLSSYPGSPSMSSPSSSSHIPPYSPAATNISDTGHGHGQGHGQGQAYQGTSSGKGFFKDKGTSFVVGAAARLRGAAARSSSNKHGHHDGRPSTANSLASTSNSVMGGSGSDVGHGRFPSSPGTSSHQSHMTSTSGSTATSKDKTTPHDAVAAYPTNSSTSPTSTTSELPKSSSLRSLGGFGLNAFRSATSSLSSSSSAASASSSSNLRKFTSRGGHSRDHVNHQQHHQDANGMSTSPSSGMEGHAMASTTSSTSSSSNTATRPSAAHRLASFSSSSSLFGSTLGLGLGHPRSSSSNSTSSNGTGHSSSNNNSNSRSFTSPSSNLSSSSSPLASNGGLHRATSMSLRAGLGAGGGGGNGAARVVLGVRIPAGRAGEVFGAPLNVAADRTRLVLLPGGQQLHQQQLNGRGGQQVQAKVEAPGLPERCGLDEEGLERRKEACRYLPAIAIRCLDYLNEYGKTEEGLYRIPGSTQQIGNLRAIFDAGADVDLLSTLSTRDLEPSAVASCFKLWLRELPESLLHNMEREIDILLLEHTGNAASSKVTMAQAQSPSASPTNPSGLAEQASTGGPVPQAGQAQGQYQNHLGGPHQLPMQQPPSMIPHQLAKGSMVPASPLVISRIKDLFANSLPKESVILLREIAYHLAHLASFSNVTKMTLANLRLILSPTLRLSPVMLALLVNEREQVFPKPGQTKPEQQDESNIIRFNSRPLDLSLPLSLSHGNSSQPHLTLSLPGEDGLPPIPPSKSPAPTVRPGSIHGSSGVSVTSASRTPLSSTDSNWTSVTSHSSSAASRRSNGSIPGYRASWHVVDLPSMGGGSGSSFHKDSLDDESEELHAATPIARKFLHQRNASASNLLEKATVASASAAAAAANAPGSASPASSVHSKHSFSSSGGAGANVLTRTPTLSGRSPSPFFSSGAPPAGLGFMASHSRKRSSASSFSSIVSNSLGADGRPLWRSRKASASTQYQEAGMTAKNGTPPQQKGPHHHQDEEEELSNSSDTNTSICSSASSAQTPKDPHDIDQGLTNAGSAESTPARRSTDSTEALDSRRATITAESFTASFARLGQGKNANSDEMKRKRGSMMVLNMPDFSAADLKKASQ